MREDIETFINSLKGIEKFWLFTGIITLICSIGFFALGYNSMLSSPLDYSWQLSLHVFFSEGKDFGKDIIFTYGPYGFLLSKTYHPKTYLFTNFCWIIFALVFWWASLSIAYKLIKNKAFIFLWFFSLFFMFCNDVSLDSFFYTFYVFWLIISLYKEDKLLNVNAILISGVIAIVSLTKFSFLIVSIPILLSITICDLLKKYKPFQLIVFLCTFFMLWLAAGQNLTSIPSFIRNGLEVAVYYNYAMAVLSVVPSIKLAAIICFFILSFLTIFLVNWEKAKIPNLLLTVGASFLIFIIIKAAYSRFGGGTTPLHTKALCFIATAYLIICFEKFSSYYIRGISIASYILILCIYQNHLSFFLQTNILSNIPNNIAYLSKNVQHSYLVVTGQLSPEKKYQEEMAALRQTYPLPSLTGSVDMYSYLQLAVLANNLDYKTRPIFQSYSAYSPLLAERNLEHLKKNPPNNIVFDNHAIEQRYPTLDDSISWPEILTKYNIKGLSPNSAFLLLEHSKNPRDYSFVSEKVIEASFNENIDVPKINLGAVWVKIQVQYSVLGHIMSAVHKPAPVYIKGKIKNGETFTYALPTPMAETGFLLSPIIRNNLDFAKFAGENWEKDLDSLQIESISVALDENSPLWQFLPKIKMSFSHLSFSRQSTSEINSVLAQETNLKTEELINLSLQQIQKGENNQAIITCEKVLDAKTRNDIAYNNMGIALLNLSLIEEAIQAFENSVKINPTFQLALNNLNYANSIKNNPIDKDKKASSYRNLGLAYINAGRLEKSIMLLDAAIKLTPNDPISYNNLSVAYTSLQFWDKAIDSANQAIKLAPDFQLAKNNLEWAKAEKVKAEKAKAEGKGNTPK
jgi:tetratricopeptide (TPR) repeat protein